MADETSDILAAFDRTFNRDQWENLITGQGQVGRDKRLSAVPLPPVFSLQDLSDAYRGDDMIQKMVDLPAKDMIRAWLDVRIPDDGECGEALGKELDRLHAKAHFRDALRWERNFGGSIVFIGANDGQSDPAMPLNEKAIQSIDFLTPFDPSECRVLEWNNNPFEESYGLPKRYAITPRIIGAEAAGLLLNDVHASRVIHFPGILSQRWQIQNSRSAYGFGDSILVRAFSIVRDFAAAFDASAVLLSDFSQAVFKINGLARAIAGDRVDLVKKRLAMIDYARSTVRAVAVDAENEDFERKSTPVSGLSDLLEQWQVRLAAAADMPVSKLMGTGAKGLNATGEGDEKIYFNEIEGKQSMHLDPRMRRLVHLLMLAKVGPCKGAEPENWSIEFRPLYSESESTQADTRLKMAQADQAYFGIGVLSPDEIRQSRFSGDHFSVNTQIDAPGESDTKDLGDMTNAELMAGQPDQGAGARDPGNASGAVAGAAPAPAAAKPSKTGAPPMPGAAAPVAPKAADSGMSGQQGTFALSIVEKVNGEQISPEQGQALLEALLYMDPTEAAKVIGKPFTPKAPEPSPLDLAKLSAKQPPKVNSDSKSKKNP